MSRRGRAALNMMKCAHCATLAPVHRSTGRAAGRAGELLQRTSGTISDSPLGSGCSPNCQAYGLRVRMDRSLQELDGPHSASRAPSSPMYWWRPECSWSSEHAIKSPCVRFTTIDAQN